MPSLSRNIDTKTIIRFRGISQYRNLAAVGMDYALDCMNCIVSGGAGHLEKLRVPIAKTNPFTLLSGPVPTIIDSFYDFQQGNGTRQIVARADDGLIYFTDDGGNVWTQHLIDDNPVNNHHTYFQDAGNILYIANGVRMMKWIGDALQNWGIVGPTVAPTLGYAQDAHVQRLTNKIVVNLDLPAQVPRYFLNPPIIGDFAQISGCSDASMNGNFAVSVSGPAGGQFSVDNTGGNTGSLAATVLLYSNPMTGPNFVAVSVERLNNVSKITFAPNFAVMVGDTIVVAGTTADGGSFNGTWVATAADSGSASWSQIGANVAIIAAGGGTVKGGVTTLVGLRSFRYAYKNSVTGAVSVASGLVEARITASGFLDHVRVFVNATASPDPQVDTIVWYSSYDAGSSWFLEGEYPIATGLFLGTAKADDKLDPINRANFINFPPPVGKYVVRWQGRLFIAGIVDNPQDIAYSGYEKVLYGNPPESYPPGNRLRLAIGADPIKGFGVLMNGVVAWSQTNQMYLFKGTVEDIVTDQPVNWSATLEELPWSTGLSSHDSVQSTPYGVVWFGSDRSFHKWNGIYYGDLIGPDDISVNINPLLQRITPGTESVVPSAYFNFMERDWYTALICVDGAIYPNRILFFDLSKDAADNMGVFISDIQADNVGVREDPNGVRHLLVSRGGQIWELKAYSTATNGVHRHPTSTDLQLSAYWQSGDDAGAGSQVVKMYRWGRLIVDQDGFQLLTTIINDDTSRLVDANPYIRKVKLDRGGRFSVNRKGRRQGFTIQFPVLDADASVLELSSNSISISQR